MEGENINNVSNLSKIISSNGNDKEAWENLLCDINSDESNICNDVISLLKKNLIDKSNVEISLDILDFLVSYGEPSIVELIAKKDFLKCILELLKNSSKSSVDIQKKIIYLTQKWAKKYENEKNMNYQTFIDNYTSLNKGGITFPPLNFKLETYTKYISDEEAQCSEIKAKAFKKIKESNKNTNNNKQNFANPFSSNENELINQKNNDNESNINNNCNLDNDKEEKLDCENDNIENENYKK